MEPYKPNEPFIKLKLDGSLLDRMVEYGIPLTRAIQYFRDNPEGSAMETLKLAAEDVIPFYGNYRNNGDWSDYAKEAALLGVPMPYIRHPKTGKPIPNNIKEALGYNGWAVTKSNWKNNKPTAKKLYSEPINERRGYYTGGNTEGGLSTRSRVNATSEARTAVDVPAGPYRETNTGSNVVNRGQQAINNNTVSREDYDHGMFNGARAWQGDMYPPGRSLRKDDMYGPFQWEDKYSRKLNNVIDENENKWEFLINKTRPSYNNHGMTPKQDIIDIALNQGRPDIAQRVINDDKPRISTNTKDPAHDKRFVSYSTNQRGEFKDNAKWKDIGNRQVEKEIREEFAALPEDPDIRFRFADYYGVPDLYESWMNDPLIWAKHRDYVQRRRHTREIGNRSQRRRVGWENPNQ